MVGHRVAAAAAEVAEAAGLAKKILLIFKYMKTENKKDTFEIKGEELLKKVKELIKEGNIRQISILNKKGRTILVLPLTIGVVGTILAPSLAAVGTIAALLTECIIKVERK